MPPLQNISGGGMPRPTAGMKFGSDTLSQFAGAFLDRCLDKGLDIEGIQKAASDASAIDEEIAAELAPLLKTAFLPALARFATAVGNKVPMLNKMWQGAKTVGSNPVVRGVGRAGIGALDGLGAGSLSGMVGGQEYDYSGTGALVGAGLGAVAPSIARRMPGVAAATKWPRRALNTTLTGAVVGPPLAGIGSTLAQWGNNKIHGYVGGLGDTFGQHAADAAKQSVGLNGNFSMDGIKDWVANKWQSLSPEAQHAIMFGGGALGLSALGGMTGLLPKGIAGLGMAAGAGGMALGSGALGDKWQSWLPKGDATPSTPVSTPQPPTPPLSGPKWEGNWGGPTHNPFQPQARNEWSSALSRQHAIT